MTTPSDEFESAILGNPIEPSKKPSRVGAVNAFKRLENDANFATQLDFDNQIALDDYWPVGAVVFVDGVKHFKHVTKGWIVYGGSGSKIRLHADDGQSNSLVKYATDSDGNEPPVIVNPHVIVQNGSTLDWVTGGSWKNAPFAGVGAPHGSDVVGGAPNIGLSFVHRLNREIGGVDYLVHNARSGRSIEKWIDTVTGAPMYDELKSKIETALATPELAGVQYVTTLVRTQSEEDYNKVSAAGVDEPGEPNYPYMPLVDTLDFKNNIDVYNTYLWALDKYLKRLKSETWWGPDSVLILNSGSKLHTRYMPMRAMQDFASKHNNVVFVSAANLETRLDVPDLTHFDGPSVHTLGYYYCWNAFNNANKSDQITSKTTSIFSNRVGEPFTRGDDTVVFPPEAGVDANFTRLSTKRRPSKTIASGVLTVDAGYHAVKNESAIALDEIDTIDGGVDGQFLFLRPASSSQDVKLKHLTGNIRMSDAIDKTMTSTRGFIILVYVADFDEWIDVRFSAS